jgi:hypothetical protein
MMGQWGQPNRSLAGCWLGAGLAIAAGWALASAAGAGQASGSPFAPDGDYTREQLREQMPRIGAVPGVEVSWVSQRMTNNGLPMSIQQLRSQRSVEAVLDAYSERFEKLGVLAPHRKGRGRFGELYGALGPYFVRLQVGRKGDETTGYLSVMAQPGTVASQRETAFPLPRSVELVSRMDYGEGTRPGITLMARSSDPPGILVNDLHKALTDGGWTRARPGEDEARQQAMRGRVSLRYEKSGQAAQVVVVERNSGNAALVVHWRQDG